MGVVTESSAEADHVSQNSLVDSHSLFGNREEIITLLENEHESTNVSFDVDRSGIGNLIAVKGNVRQ